MVIVFRDGPLPEPGTPTGYAWLIERFGLELPLPPRLTAIAKRHHPQSTDEWQMLTPRHAPPETLPRQLEFALKWEGVDLAVLSALFRVAPDGDLAAAVREKPTGAYARRLWFLFEWLTGRTLDLPGPGKVRAVLAVDRDQQFALEDGAISSRHKVRDNLPGTSAFCPLVRRTPELDRYRSLRLEEKARNVIGRTHPDLVRRAAAFLLLEDSRASFQIEGERPSSTRAARWGQIIGEAGKIPLSVEELERLQRIVIGDSRFVRLGLRARGGFVGQHDRLTGEPLPNHISALAGDLRSLLDGAVEYEKRAVEGGMDPVVTAAALSFGFVYIHPFEDGNGRLHRWLIHHVLSRSDYNPPGVVFPVSAVMLRQIGEYHRVLESYSKPLLNFIEWRPTGRGNVEVVNKTGDYYRFFDATAHAEFLYRCVEETVTNDLPREVQYLQSYDEFSRRLQETMDMPSSIIDLLIRFLQQGKGHLSRRARTREFKQLTDDEVDRIEQLYAECFTKAATGAGGE
ncbi:MAG: Fic family protein [Acidobacteriota bacterium]